MYILIRQSIIISCIAMLFYLLPEKVTNYFEKLSRYELRLFSEVQRPSTVSCIIIHSYWYFSSVVYARLINCTVEHATCANFAMHPYTKRSALRAIIR